MSVHEKIKKRNRIWRILLIVLGALVLLFVAAGVYVISLWKNGDRLNRETMFVASPTAEISFSRETPLPEAIPTPTPMPYEGKPTVLHNSKHYVRNEDVFSVLFMGIDTTDDRQYENIGLNSNQADSLILAAVDGKDGSITMINIPRNSITDVKQLDASFNYARTTKSPICIQHGFGDGKALSCELTREAASNLLFNLPISRYISMNLDGLFMANDAIGGVTVNVLDDMTAFNPKMKKGADYTLNGRDARIYVASRLGKGLDGTNMSRVKRQVQYYKAFFSKAKDKLKEDPLFGLNLYQSMQSSVETDLSVDEIIYLSKAVMNANLTDENIHTLTGTVEEENFFVDDEALKELLIGVFYVEATPEA